MKSMRSTTTRAAEMIGRLQDIGISVPFGLNANLRTIMIPSQVIADIRAAGLGLPDRDYYIKTEERFQQARATYLVHVAKMFAVAGYTRCRCAEGSRVGDAV